MTIYTKYTVSGVEYTDVLRSRVQSTVSESSSSSNFDIVFPNDYGTHSGTFTLGNEVSIASQNYPLYTPLRQWRMNEGTGSFFYDTVSSSVGSIYSGAGFTVGRIGSALNLTGSPNVGIITGFNPSTFNQLTVACWLQQGTYVAGNRFIDLQDTGRAHGFDLAQDQEGTGSVSVNISSGAGASLAKLQIGSFTSGTWYHVAFTQDNTNKILTGYLNGSLIGSTTNSYMSTSAIADVALGKRTGGTGFDFFWMACKIDDLRFYNTVLGSANIQDIYNSGVGTELYYGENPTIFTGVIEDIRFQSNEQKQTVTLTGRDYSARLMDVTVPPTSYNNLEAGSIVRHILANYVNNAIGSANVGSFFTGAITTGSIKNIRFNHTPVFEAIGQIADYVNASYYVDENKDLHFGRRGTLSSNTTLSSGNIISVQVRSTDQDVFNQVYVYGDRQLSALRETFIPDGAGSVFTLGYRPHNTQVLVNGSVQRGGILEVNAIPTSGIDYLIDFDQRLTVFVSGGSPIGNGLGYNSIPQTGSTLEINYDRDTPIAKLARDNVSIATYGLKEKVIQDKNIKDPTQAKDLAKQTLASSKDPKAQLTIQPRTISHLQAGNTIVVDLPHMSINNQTYDIIDVTYDFNTSNNLSEKVVSLNVSKKLPDITDTIKEMMLAIKKLQGDQTIDIDVITRLETSTGSVGMRVPQYWRFKTNTTGSSYIIGHPEKGRIGDLHGFLTGSPFYVMGDGRTVLITQVSGGQV